MANTETEEVLAKVTWEADSKDLEAGINATANVVQALGSTFTRLMAASIQLQQSNLSLTQSFWSLADAKRENARLSARNLQLDLQISRVAAEIAQRNLLITQRTGRLLDVQMARLQVQRAQRDVTLQQFGIDDKERGVKRNLITAEEQLSILQRQRNLMLIQLTFQTGLMTAAIVKLITAEMVRQSVMTAGASIGVSIVAGLAAAGGAALLASSIMSTGDEGPPIDTLQTTPSESRQIRRTGLALVHQGETISRGGDTNDNSVSSSQTIIINAPSGNANEIANILGERLFLETQPLIFGTPPA